MVRSVFPTASLQSDGRLGRLRGRLGGAGPGAGSWSISVGFH